MLLMFAFLLEEHGFGSYFPDYRDSMRLSVDYYTGSTFPLVVGCFRGFCLYAGTYSGTYRDSTFYLRDHVKIVDTIRLRRSAIQEWATLSRFFYAGRMLLGFEVGLMKEQFASVLTSYNGVFPDNRLSLGNERRGMVFGGVIGYGRDNLDGYVLFRYWNVVKDSSISSGDTTGWIITVPEPLNSNVELLAHINWRNLSLSVSYRERILGYLRLSGDIFSFAYILSAGYSQKDGPMCAIGVGKDIGGFGFMLGAGFVSSPLVGVALRYSFLK
ncbi:MAG: hypothetical protein GXO39_05850 [Thermotogae bacterium]|nr:hypothetical protein [Thermotogota bacterium]